MNSKYKSVEHIINKLLSNPLMENINESDLAQYVGDAIKLIAAPLSFEDKTCTIPIKEYKGVLPTELLYVIQSSWQETNGNLYAMRYATSTFASKYHEVGSPDFTTISEYSYSMNNNYIHTNAPTGSVVMLYKGLVVDEKGFPMIPDNIKFEKAIEEYVKKEHYRILWEMGKVPDKVFDFVQREYDFYVGAAQSAGQLMTIDQAESFANAFSRLLLKPLQHQSFFVNHGSREYFKDNRI
jgi:hypothetical protein